MSGDASKISASPFDGAQSLLSRQELTLAEKDAELARRSRELTAANERLREEMRRRAAAEHALAGATEQLAGWSDREAERWGIAALVGRSGAIGQIVAEVKRLANFDSLNILIAGESGTGKELVARVLHYGSSRAKGPFIPVNCVALCEDLAESLLFGHIRGAFPGAGADRKGCFEMAHRGCLFLDEVGDLPLFLQGKLLRAIEDRCVTPVGSSRERKIDVRIIAATNANLAMLIDAGTFRQDLYVLLAQHTVSTPPLRERQEDVPILVQHFSKMFAAEMGMPTPAIEPEAMRMLSVYPFPGNVRELKNVIERALIESGGLQVRVADLRLGRGAERAAPTNATPAARAKAAGDGAIAGAGDLPLNLEAAETILIRRALAETGGNIAEAARRLGVNRTRIYRKLSDANPVAP